MKIPHYEKHVRFSKTIFAYTTIYGAVILTTLGH